MAVKKRKKAGKKTPPARAAKTRKAPVRKAKKTAKKKTAKKAKSAKRVKAAARKPARKASKKKQIVGEGDYQASRTFLKDQSDFVKKNRSSIPAMGRQAGRALEGPEGNALREAEAEAASRSRENLT